jgi:hypothetical protein
MIHHLAGQNEKLGIGIERSARRRRFTTGRDRPFLPFLPILPILLFESF